MAGKAFDREQIERCVQILDELAQSGQSSQDFALERGLSYGQLRAWQSHAPRWRAQLAGVAYVSQRKVASPSGFIQLGAHDQPSIAPAAQQAYNIRIDCSMGARSVVVHWPVQAPAECAQWLKTYLA